MGIKTLEDLHAKIEEMDDDIEQSPADETEILEETPVEPEVTDDTPEEIETSETPEAEAIEGEEGAEGEETPKYEANLKYKAMKEEYDLPEYLTAVIDSPEKEEEIKKIYSKAMGMDHFASKNEMMKKQLDDVAPVMQDVNAFNKMLDEKNYHSAFKLAGVNDDDILKLAGNILEIRELTPEQQTVYNNNIQSNHRLHQLEAENQRLQQQFTNSNETGQLQELETVMTSGDTANISTSYDTRMGKAGAFREAVINNAAMIEFQTKGNPDGPTILTPQEAVASFIKASGLTAQEVNQQVGDAGQTQQTVVKPTVIVKKDKPTIPNVKAGNKNPVKKKVKTLADLQALAEGLDDY